ncbi:MAG: RNA polymerase sigma factor [Deltaproteobacteria bacterium CG_4_10_14_3_um_filter_60_8]|nr:MAG: RNA polymerase subunit sigma-24 [Deltaproteobacteria bacterium CG23_combo_of_CG06-09_8_20_14_all_60_8]PIY20212.1 MAG: RNA polymerase sigma factor [Deltaproteobacteria bacterium CG_4_10_14_3_um_filter_60_8]
MATIIDLMRFRSGPSRFEALLRPYLQPLFRTAFRFAGNVADAEDLVQDVLVKLYAKRQDLDKIEKLQPWLMKVLFRTFVDRKRKRDRAPVILAALGGRDGHEYADFFEALPSDRPGPAATVEAMFTQQRLHLALAALNEDQRTLCVLHDMEGYTLHELEDILDTPIGTLKSRLHRARARLRGLLLAEGTLPSVQTSINQ